MKRRKTKQITLVTVLDTRLTLGLVLLGQGGATVVENTKMKEPKTITITLQLYESLMEDSKFLGALDAAGVDGWHGYDYAQTLHEERDY